MGSAEHCSGTVTLTEGKNSLDKGARGEGRLQNSQVVPLKRGLLIYLMNSYSIFPLERALKAASKVKNVQW